MSEKDLPQGETSPKPSSALLNNLEQQTAQQRKTSVRTEVFEWTTTVIWALVMVALVFTFLFRTVVVSGSSMVPTLHDKDTLIASRLGYVPRFGDIVVINQPNPFEKTLIKRVIATEGQTVYVDTLNDIIYVDDVAVDDSFLGEPMNVIYGGEGPLVVPEGCVYVCGDNRNHSADSRTPSVGVIRTDYIAGRIVWGLSPFGSGMVY